MAQRDYYEILEIEKTATPEQIKKSYYLKARQYHPDKNADNPQAEELFKTISEAYTVLSDPEKRKTYDKFGKAGLENNSSLDFNVLLQQIFGMGKFNDNYGELSFLQHLAQSFTEDPDSNPDQATLQMEENARRQEALLVRKLTIKLEPFLTCPDEGLFRKILESDVAEKAEAPGGPALLEIIGDMYISKGKQHMGRAFGVEGFFSGIAEKGQLLGQVYDVASISLKLMREMENQQDPEKMDEKTVTNLTKMGLSAIWAFGKLQITQTCASVCETLLTEPGLPEELLQKRARGVYLIGQKYMAAAKEAKSKNTIKGSNKNLPTHLEQMFEKDPSQEHPTEKDNNNITH